MGPKKLKIQMSKHRAKAVREPAQAACGQRLEPHRQSYRLCWLRLRGRGQAAVLQQHFSSAWRQGNVQRRFVAPPLSQVVRPRQQQQRDADARHQPPHGRDADAEQ